MLYLSHGNDGIRRPPIAIAAAVGVVLATLAWWLVDVLVREQSEQVNLAAGETRLSGLFLLLGLSGVGLLSIAVTVWSGIAGIAGLGVFVSGLILGGYGSGKAFWVPEGDIGFIVLRGAHEPAIYVLLAAWLGGTLMHFLPAVRTGRLPPAVPPEDSDDTP